MPVRVFLTLQEYLHISYLAYKMCHGKHRALGGHLDGLTQSITFLSGSLSTNLACLLTRLPRVFNGGQRRVEAYFNRRVFSLSGLADRVRCVKISACEWQHQVTSVRQTVGEPNLCISCLVVNL